jgi:SAM-dependent methyltransferase
MKINIGCGRDYKAGWLNTDISRDCKADAYFDIRKDIIVKGPRVGDKVVDNSADYVYISGVLEQIGENEHLVHAMNECWRVLKDGGIMEVIVPNARFAIAHQDPMDVRKFTKETFLYFLGGSRQYKLYGSVYGFKPWSDISIEENERHIMIIKMKK